MTGLRRVVMAWTLRNRGFLVSDRGRVIYQVVMGRRTHP